MSKVVLFCGVWNYTYVRSLRMSVVWFSLLYVCSGPSRFSFVNP